MSINIHELSPIQIVDISRHQTDYYARGKNIALQQGASLTDTDFDLYKQAWHAEGVLPSNEDPLRKVRRLRRTYSSAQDDVRDIIAGVVYSACADLIKASRRKSLVPITVGRKVVFERVR